MDSAGPEREGKKEREADACGSAAASRGILLMTEKAARGEADGLEREGCGEGMVCWLLSGEGEGYGFLPCKRREGGRVL